MAAHHEYGAAATIHCLIDPQRALLRAWRLPSKSDFTIAKILAAGEGYQGDIPVFKPTAHVKTGGEQIALRPGLLLPGKLSNFHLDSGGRVQHRVGMCSPYEICFQQWKGPGFPVTTTSGAHQALRAENRSCERRFAEGALEYPHFRNSRDARAKSV